MSTVKDFDTLEVAETLVDAAIPDAPANLIGAVEMVIDSISSYIVTASGWVGTDVWEGMATLGIFEDFFKWSAKHAPQTLQPSASNLQAPKRFDWTKTAVDDRIVRIGRDGTSPSNVYNCQCCGYIINTGDQCHEVFLYYSGNLISQGFFCSRCY